MSETGLVMEKPLQEFWDNIDCLLDQNTMEYAINKLLRSARPCLDNESLTAIAIDQQESIEKIAEKASEEGHSGLAEALRFCNF